jgi:hypothetical protein
MQSIFFEILWPILAASGIQPVWPLPTKSVPRLIAPSYIQDAVFRTLSQVRQKRGLNVYPQMVNLPAKK